MARSKVFLLKDETKRAKQSVLFYYRQLRNVLSVFHTISFRDGLTRIELDLTNYAVR